MEETIKKIVETLKPECCLEVLKECCILCNWGIDSVDLFEVIQVGSPQTFSKILKSLIKSGLLQECDSTIYSPKEVCMVMSEYPISKQRINVLIKNLIDKTYYSAYVDQTKVKSFYIMSQEVIRYILAEHKWEDDIDYIAFSKLIINICDMYCAYARIEEDVLRPEDLTIYKALQICIDKIEANSLLSARLLLSQAYLYQAGFFYKEAREKIAAAESIIDKADEYDTQERVAMCVVRGLFFENYGDILKSLSNFYDAYNLCVKLGLEDLRCLISMFIYYQLMLISDVETAEDWAKRVHVLALPDNNVLQVFYHLGNALSSFDDSNTESELIYTEHCIKTINQDSPLLARLYYVRSRITAQTKKSNEYYKKYAQQVALVHCSSDAAFKIFYSGEVVRFTRQGSLITAKNLVIDQLDSINILSSDLSCSLRLEVLNAYVEYHLADKNQAMLADAYCDQAIHLLEQMQASEKLDKVSCLFKYGTVPVSLLDNISYDFMVKKIEALVDIAKKEPPIVLNANGYKDIINDIRQIVEELARRFPNRISEIEIIEAYILSITDPYNCCIRFSQILQNAFNYRKKLILALNAARYAKRFGFIYESCDYYKVSVSSEAFNELNSENQSTLLQEYADILEECRSSKALEIWDKALELTQESDSKANIFYSQAVRNYERGAYQLALMNIQLCHCFYEREGLVDEQLAYIFGWEANIYCSLNRFDEAKASISNGLDVCPPYYKEDIGFKLNYTYAYTLLALGDPKARAALEETKKLASDPKEKDMINKLYDILKLPLSERKQYFIQPIKDNDTDIGDIIIN